MKREIKRLIISSLALLFCASKAFIYDIRVMRRWDNASRHYCYFIGLGDFHDKHHKITATHIADIDAIIRKCDPSRTKLIFEDISSPGFLGKCSCRKFFVNSNGGVLGGLSKKYKNKGFKDIENVEYRFCRVTSLAPVINNINANYRKFLPTSRITIENFKNEIVDISKDILSYKDGNILRSWYKKCVAQAENNMKVLKFNSMLTMNIADFVYKNSNAQNRLNFVKKLLVFDSPLIDAKIVHSIVNARGKQNIIAIAGGSHIKNVSCVLQKIGFRPVYNSKIVIKREYNPRKCLGCNVAPGGFCSRPQPADLKILNRFL